MKLLRTVPLFLVALGLTALAPSNADAEFTPPAVSYAFSGKSSIKVTEPAGFKVAINVDGKAVEDTIPHIFPVADVDAYVPVTVTAPDGKQWSGKIEVKNRHQTQLAFKYTAAGPAPAPARAPRKFIGHLSNSADRCVANLRFALRYELLDDAGTLVQQIDLTPGQDKTAEIPAGTYSARVYHYTGTEWKFFDTVKGVTVADDKWAFGIGCTKKNGSALSRTR